MASVVSGIVNNPQFAVTPSEDSLGAEAGAACASVLAACALSRTETAMTDSSGKNKMKERVFMRASVYAKHAILSHAESRRRYYLAGNTNRPQQQFHCNASSIIFAKIDRISTSLYMAHLSYR